MKALKKIGFTLLGLLGLVALMCSIAASCVTNANLMYQGFINHGNTAHLNFPGEYYDEAAQGIAQYMDGQKDAIPHPDGSGNPLFSEDEMLHLKDVQGIVSILKIIRWAGGLMAIAGIGIAWFLSKKKEPNTVMQSVWQGFAWASGILFSLAAGLCIWALCDFDSLFLAFHHLAFSNDLWLMDPNTDLMIAMMPETFFMWYGGEMLKSLLPIFGCMLCLLISWLKLGRKETEGTEDKQ